MTWYLRSLVDDSQWLRYDVCESHVSVLIYDVSNRSSFDYLSDFYLNLQSELSSLPSSSDGMQKPIFVLANKVDLPATVTKSEGQAFFGRERFNEFDM
jgi:hypothetical protein